MAQFARPTLVISGAGWTGAVTDIDEAVTDDNDKMVGPPAPTGVDDYLEVQVGDLIDPVVHTGHVIYGRVCKDAAAGAQVDCTMTLHQGSTLIATAPTKTNLTATPDDYSYTLSEAEAEAITAPYSDLRLRFTFVQV